MMLAATILCFLPIVLRKHGIVGIVGGILLAIPAIAAIMGGIMSFKEAWEDDD